MKITLPALLAATLAALGTLATPAAAAIDSVVVDKSERRLYLKDNGRVVKQYKIGLGRQPNGAKRRQGDGRTPEGRYRITGKNPHSSFYRSLRISYPNAADVARARKLKRHPGGNIMIHGVGPHPTARAWARKRRDWTQGCIALSDRDMREVYKLVPVGTPIEIRP